MSCQPFGSVLSWVCVDAVLIAFTVGICDLHVTVGEAETDRFQKQQDENRLLKRKFFDKLDVDLSEPLAPEIEEPSMEAMTQRKMDDFMAGAVGSAWLPLCVSIQRGFVHESQKAWVALGPTMLSRSG
jgi:hypothetical protein